MAEPHNQTGPEPESGRKPVVLSNKEALYPPNKQALAIAIAAIVVAIAALAIYLICTL